MGRIRNSDVTMLADKCVSVDGGRVFLLQYLTEIAISGSKKNSLNTSGESNRVLREFYLRHNWLSKPQQRQCANLCGEIALGVQAPQQCSAYT